MDREEVKKLIYEKGSYSKVAKHFKVSRERIRQIGKELGIDILKLRASNPEKYLSQPKTHTIKCVVCKTKVLTLNKHKKCCSKECLHKHMVAMYK